MIGDGVAHVPELHQGRVVRVFDEDVGVQDKVVALHLLLRHRFGVLLVLLLLL